MSLPKRTLTRWVKTPDGVFGRLSRWVTLEEEDLDNRPNVSCIPTGVYVCERTVYHKHGYEVFEVKDVPGRSNVLLHVINTEEDTEGCIGLGLQLGILVRADEDTGERRPKLAILSSRPAFNAFMAELAGVDRFILEIREAEGLAETGA